MVPPIAPLQLDGINWYVITESNFAEVMAKLKANGTPPVVFALDERGYENLSIDMTKIRAYIAQQKTVIVALKDYYDVPDTPATLAPAPSKLTQGTGLGSGINPVAPAAAPTTQVVPTAPVAQSATPAPAVKKGAAKFIPPFVKIK